MSFLDEVKSKAAEALSGQTSDQTSGLLGGVLEMVKNQPGDCLDWSRPFTTKVSVES